MIRRGKHLNILKDRQAQARSGVITVSGVFFGNYHYQFSLLRFAPVWPVVYGFRGLYVFFKEKKKKKMLGVVQEDCSINTR